MLKYGHLLMLNYGHLLRALFFSVENFVAFILGVLEHLHRRAIAYWNQWKNVLHSFNLFFCVGGWSQKLVYDWAGSINGWVIFICCVMCVWLIGKFGRKPVFCSKKTHYYSESPTKSPMNYTQMTQYSVELLTGATHAKNIKTMQYIFFTDSNKL